MSAPAVRPDFLALPIAQIDEPPLPSRSAMDDAGLDELALSIRTIGLQQPLVVRRVGERVEVIAGHRRLIACRRAGLTDVPCLVYPTDTVSLVAIQAHENSKREDLNPADEAIWFMQLLEQHCGGDIDQLCGLVGEKLHYVDNRIALLRGDPLVFAALQRGDLKIGVAHELNKCPDAYYRKYFLDCAVRSGATIATVTGWILEWKQSLGGQAPAAPVEEAAAPGIATGIVSPFTCLICGKADNVHLIRQVNVHQHCHMAILEPMLAHARGEA